MGKTAKAIVAIIGIFVIMPMWFFLLYNILKQGQHDRLVWFIFWAYIPLGIITRIISEIADSE